MVIEGRWLEMPKVNIVEKRIFDIEEFQVVIRGQNGKDKRGDFVLPKQYVAERKTRNSHSVSQWKSKFQEQFPGYEVDVLLGNGDKARGQMLLSTVRDSYLTEDC